MDAREIMTTEVYRIQSSATVAEAVRLLKRHMISGLPVVDADERIVGVITGGDILRLFQQRAQKIYHSLFGITEVINDEAVWRENRHALLNLPVQKMMSRGAVTVGPTTPVGEIADLMLRQKVRRVFVLENDRMVGIVTRNDIVRWLITGLETTRPPKTPVS